MEEEWRDVIGYEGWYQVSSLGNVRSVDRDILYSNGRIHHTKGVNLVQVLDKSGYPVVGLSKNQKINMCKVHRLVCLAFTPNPEDKQQVNHIDGVKTNNVVTNLEWNTSSENQQHCVDNGLRVIGKGELSSAPKLKEVEVVEIKKLLNRGVKQRDIAKMYDVHFATISAIYRGKSWSHVVVTLE